MTATNINFNMNSDIFFYFVFTLIFLNSFFTWLIWLLELLRWFWLLADWFGDLKISAGTRDKICRSLLLLLNWVKDLFKGFYLYGVIRIFLCMSCLPIRLIFLDGLWGINYWDLFNFYLGLCFMGTGNIGSKEGAFRCLVATGISRLLINWSIYL